MVAAGRRLQRWKHRRLAERVGDIRPGSAARGPPLGHGYPDRRPEVQRLPESRRPPRYDCSRPGPTHGSGPKCCSGAGVRADRFGGSGCCRDGFRRRHTHCQLDHLLERMRLSPCGPGVTGSLFQWSRRTLDGVRVTEVWQSRQYFEITFREDIQPRLSGIGLPDPEITTYEVHSFLTQGPTVAQQARGVDRQ